MKGRSGNINKTVENYFAEEEEANSRLLHDKNNSQYKETSYTGEYGFYNLMRVLSHLLQMGGEAAINALMTFLTWFPKLVPQFAFIFIFPIFTVTAQYLYGAGKILLHPLMNWKQKTFFLSAITPAASLILAPLVSNFFLEFLRITFIGFLKIASIAPFLFTGALAIYTALNAYQLVKKTWEFLQNSYKRTPLAKLTLANKLVKTTALATITAVIIPLMLTLGAITLFTNPFTAGPTAAILFTILMAASATIVTMKIVHTVVKHRLQEKMARDALEGIKDGHGRMKQEAFSPYELMDITQAQINDILKRPRKLMFLNKRDLKIALEKHFNDAKRDIESDYVNNPRTGKLSPADEAEKNARLYKLQLAYEMLNHPRAREMFDAFKAVKDLKESGSTMMQLQERQSQFGVVSKLQKTIPVSWLMRPIAAIIYQVKKSSLGDNEKAQELALSYRLATNAALSNYYEEVSQRSAPAKPVTPDIEQSSSEEDDDNGYESPSQTAAYDIRQKEYGKSSSSSSKPIPRARETFASGKRSPSSPTSVFAGSFTVYSPSSDSSARSSTNSSANSSLASTATDDDAQPRKQQPLTYGKYGAP